MHQIVNQCNFFYMFEAIDEIGQQWEYDAREGFPHNMHMESDIIKEIWLNVDLWFIVIRKKIDYWLIIDYSTPHFCHFNNDI